MKKMKSLMSFFDSSMTRSEMKSVKGGLCSSQCYGNGWAMQPIYGNKSEVLSKEGKATCSSNGGSTRWCCANCTDGPSKVCSWC